MSDARLLDELAQSFLARYRRGERRETERDAKTEAPPLHARGLAESRPAKLPSSAGAFSCGADLRHRALPPHRYRKRGSNAPVSRL